MTEKNAGSFSSILGIEDFLLNEPDENRGSLVKRLVQNLVDTGKIKSSQISSAMRGLNEREAIGSTAIGGGVAIPHARVGFVDKPIGAFALIKDGVGFNSLDGGKVQFIFLFFIPKNDQTGHIALMKSITRFSSEPTHLKALSNCVTPEDVLGVFQDYA